LFDVFSKREPGSTSSARKRYSICYPLGASLHEAAALLLRQVLPLSGHTRIRERRMSGYFRRQLADYVQYHRDPRNCALHVVGIVALFLAAVIPLSSWTISVFGVGASAAMVAVGPVLIYWLLLDAGLGLAIAGAAALLLSAAAAIGSHASTAGAWLITGVLIVIGVAAQIVGHRVFERRQPALIDNPAHLLLGPMFVMAKLMIALGFRQDLADVIQPVQPPTRGGPPLRSWEGAEELEGGPRPPS
jgi:uncharacterized membrane protein YGL010W